MINKSALLVATMLAATAASSPAPRSFGYAAPNGYAPKNRSSTKAPKSKRVQAKIKKAKRRP